MSNEREETEVKKNKKWLRDRYESMETIKATTKNSRGKRSTSYLKKKTVINLLNQLDEPEITEDQAYKDGYEKGKEHATEKQSEETETVASVLVDYLIASAKLKLALSMEVEELEK